MSAGVQIRKLPSWMPMGAITLGHTIYAKNPDSPSMLAHEMTHVHQQERVGAWKFYLLYVFVLPAFWNPWRLKWEAEAYLNQVARGGITLDDAARSLSSPLYLWICSYEKARLAIAYSHVEGA